MERSSHGVVSESQKFREARDAALATIKDKELGFAVGAKPVVSEDFGFLFDDLQEDDDNLLAENSETRNALVRLGEAMNDRDETGARDSTIPGAYTYFGQFLDHDITLELKSNKIADITSNDLRPLDIAVIAKDLQNARTATLDLDSVYGSPAPRDEDSKKMLIGQVSSSGGRPSGKDDDNDLPRSGRSENPKKDRAAQTGDPRNDENLVVAQMHVAFLRAHNELVDRGRTFQQARRLLRRHYQHVVLHDFLKRIVDPRVVDDLLENGNRIYHPEREHFFMPLEFSVAAYRFGHSMIRGTYNYNVNFQSATLDELFMFTALSGQLAEFDTLPENWIIEWERFLPGFGAFDRARKIDTRLVEPLDQLKNVDGTVLPPVLKSLASRNLLRGYLLRLPTGQAVARSLRQKLSGVRRIPVLKGAEIKGAVRNESQIKILEDAGFLNRTPLWYYILAEAALEGGNRLGPVGGTIVAEVLFGLIKRSEHSILNLSDWEPTLPSETPGQFTLSDLLRFAGVLT